MNETLEIYGNQHDDFNSTRAVLHTHHINTFDIQFKHCANNHGGDKY